MQCVQYAFHSDNKDFLFSSVKMAIRYINPILTNLLAVKAVIIDYTARRALCSHSCVLISLLFRQRRTGNTFEYAAGCNAGLKSV